MPSGDELRRVQEIYFGVFPDGRDRLHWKGLIHVRVKPLWIRYSNYSRSRRWSSSSTRRRCACCRSA